MINKIKIRKISNLWRIEYYYPYAGLLYFDKLTFKEAVKSIDPILDALKWA